MMTFDTAWAQKVADGFRWSDSNIAKARMGWNMAVQMLDSFNSPAAWHPNHDRTVAVADNLEMLPMATCPIGLKVWLQGPGGQTAPGIYDGRDTQWRGWFPYPKSRSES